jgi:dihydropyrimidinase
MNLLIKNGTIVTAESTFKADIAVSNGKISMIGASIKPGKDTEVIDAKGKYVLPGAVDVHTHLALPFGGTVSADDYYYGTKAAACGGTTTVFDFAIQNAGETMPETVKRRDALCAPDAVVDYSFHVGVTDISDNKLDTMLDSVKMGVPSFKVFMTYSFGISDGEFYQALEKAKMYGALIQVHAENDQMINLLRDKYLSEGKTDAWHHYLSRPEFVEC